MSRKTSKRVHALDHPRVRLVGEEWPQVPMRDRLAWWLADKALRLASRQYRGRLRKVYVMGLMCRVEHQGFSDEPKVVDGLMFQHVSCNERCARCGLYGCGVDMCRCKAHGGGQQEEKR